MTWGPALTELQRILAKRYQAVSDCRRIVIQAGLEAEYIRLEGKIINVWHNILSEAENRGKVETIIDIALGEYSNDKELEQAVQGYRSRREMLPPETGDDYCAFEYDVFISYADRDDRPFGDSEEGWIAAFCRRLEDRLEVLLGEDLELLSSRKLLEHDLDQTSVEQLCNSAVLVAVLSPSYVRTPRCLEEVERFRRAAVERGNVRIDSAHRIYRVVKTRFPQEEHPSGLQDSPHYEFFEYDPHSGRFREFLPFYERKYRDLYWQKLWDLAEDISKPLELVKTRPARLPRPVRDVGATVYLAETASDLTRERDQIRRELKYHGHTVLPDRTLPMRSPDLEEMVRETLERCDLSIHLVGESYAIVPEAADSSLVELQNQLAAEHSQNTGFTRIIWIPAGLELDQIKNKHQQRFVNALQTDPAARRAADLLHTNLEELKTEILDNLRSKLEQASRPEAAPPMGEELTRIYLIYGRQDGDDVKPLSEYLHSQKFKVLKLDSDNGRSGEARKHHDDFLRQCDAVLIYHGQTNASWLQTKLHDLQKSPGLGRTKPMLAKAIYLASPESQEKADFRPHEVDEVISHFADFSPHALDPFLTRIEARRGEQG